MTVMIFSFFLSFLFPNNSISLPAMNKSKIQLDSKEDLFFVKRNLLEESLKDQVFSPKERKELEKVNFPFFPSSFLLSFHLFCLLPSFFPKFRFSIKSSPWLKRTLKLMDLIGRLLIIMWKVEISTYLRLCRKI